MKDYSTSQRALGGCVRLPTKDDKMESSEPGLTSDLFVLSIRWASLGIKYQRRARFRLFPQRQGTHMFLATTLTTLLRLKISKFLCLSTKLEAAGLGKVSNERSAIQNKTKL